MLGDTHTVLLVEDDPLTRLFLANLIQEAADALLGEGRLCVITAMSGEEAMARLEEPGARFRALVTDIKLGRPDLLGWDVARRARQLTPDLPVVYISGDSAHDWGSKGVADSFMLAKPIVPAQFAAVVAQLIDPCIRTSGGDAAAA